jgi:hypothetical protein
MNTKNRTLVIDLSACNQNDIAPCIIGAARANSVQSYWGTNAVLLSLMPGVEAHRSLESSIRASGLPVHVRM